MNTNLVISRIKTELDDQGVFYTDQDVIDAVQDTYEDLAFITSCIEKTTQQNAPVSPYWDVSAVIPDYYRMFAIYDRNQSKFLEPTYYRIMQEFHTQWESQTGSPVYWAPIGFKHIAMYPHYSTVPAENFDLYYAAFAPDITSSNVLTLPGNAVEVVVDGALSQLFLQSLEIEKAETRLGDYDFGARKVQREMDRRNNSDRIRQMQVMYGQLG